MHRRKFIATSISALTLATTVDAQGAGFGNWIGQFQSRAQAAGISDRTFQAAFASVGYLPDSIERDRNQAVFVRPLADYMASAASGTRVRNGRDKANRYANVLSQIEARFDVEPHVVTAVWGMESNYGQGRGDIPLISTLATLAYDGRRGRFVRRHIKWDIRAA